MKEPKQEIMKGQHLAMTKDIKSGADRSKKILKSNKPTGETQMKIPTINAQAKGAIKAIAVIIGIISLITAGWVLNDQFDAHVTAKAKELSSKLSQ